MGQNRIQLPHRLGGSAVVSHPAIDAREIEGRAYGNIGVFRGQSVRKRLLSILNGGFIVVDSEYTRRPDLRDSARRAAALRGRLR